MSPLLHLAAFGVLPALLGACNAGSPVRRPQRSNAAVHTAPASGCPDDLAVHVVYNVFDPEQNEHWVLFHKTVSAEEDLVLAGDLDVGGWEEGWELAAVSLDVARAYGVESPAQPVWVFHRSDAPPCEARAMGLAELPDGSVVSRLELQSCTLPSDGFENSTEPRGYPALVQHEPPGACRFRIATLEPLDVEGIRALGAPKEFLASLDPNACKAPACAVHTRFHRTTLGDFTIAEGDVSHAIAGEPCEATREHGWRGIRRTEAVVSNALRGMSRAKLWSCAEP